MTADDHAHITDSNVVALPTMLGPEVDEILGEVVALQGALLVSTRIGQIRYEPAKSMVVRYEADVRWNDGRSTRETLVAASGIPVPPGVPILSSGDMEIAVWSYATDPFLPGLATAASTKRTAALLDQLGVQAAKPKLRRRAYRPGRRAVVEVTTPQARVFLKVVRPSQVAVLQEKHKVLAAAVPVPHSHGWSKSLGLVALQAMPGKPLRKALESGRRLLPTAAHLKALLDELPEVGDAAEVTGPEYRAAFHARLLKAVTPDLSDRIDALLAGLSADHEEADVPVHGDFHSSQLLARGTSLVGLIDVDTAGVGKRSNDVATLLGHISAVGLSTAARRSIDRYGSNLIREFDPSIDPTALRRKVAAVIIGLATGPFRVNQPRWRAQTERRIALAERWMASAEKTNRM